eukprot:Skav209210  [mRNA]  locus=scaffold3533:20101:20734:+ [translate_table: standard]
MGDKNCRMLKPRHLGSSRIGKGRYAKSVCSFWLGFLLSFIFDRFCWPMEHAAMLFPVVHWGQQCPEHHIARMHLEGNQWVIDGFVKAKACNHSPQVAASSDKSGDYCKLLLVHERHNTIARPFCHLHKQGETHKDSQCNVPWL